MDKNFFPGQKRSKLSAVIYCACFSWIVFSMGSCLLASCGNKNHSAAASLSSGSKPYGVIIVAPRTTIVYSDFPATIQGQQNVEIRPQIDGYMQALYVDEGSVVKKGQLLFRISAETYKQDVRTAEANIKIAKADLNAAQMQVNKVRPLVERNI